jgi:[ribosomal protein S18]-alanine N-acetyltransferase
MQLIRRYTATDKQSLLEILRLNTPQYFAPEEEADFVTYLDQLAEHYYVVEEAGKIVGSGGFNFLDNETWVRISWDLIHPEYQGRGIGKALTTFRIAEIKQKPTVRLIQVRTTQLVYPFYQKLGFELEKVEKDFWAKGFDLYQLYIALDKTSEK